MINPNTVNIVIYQSATFDKSMTWMDNGEAVDLEDCQIALQVRDRAHGNALLLTASTSNGMINIVDEAKGVFQFNVPASVTEALEFVVGSYDLLIKKGERVCRIAQGDVMLSRSNTKLEAFDVPTEEDEEDEFINPPEEETP